MMPDSKGDGFPVLWQYAGRRRPDTRPKTIPWALIERGRAQAMRNHGQTLERLAQRGGLCPVEIVAAIDGHGLKWIFGKDEAEVAACIVFAS